MIAGTGAVILIFIVMLVLTRAVIAAAVIVGTVLLSWVPRSACRCCCGSTSWASNYIG